MIIAVMVLSMLLACAPSAYGGGPADAVKGLVEGVAKLYGAMTTNQIMLYSSCMGYYMKFNKWPSSEADLENLAGADKNSDNEKEKNDLAGLLNSLDLTFTPTPDGSVLIEGHYREDLEKGFEKVGLGKCRISVIARKTEDGFLFSPSEKVKGDKDYFTIPMKSKPKQPEVK